MSGRSDLRRRPTCRGRFAGLLHPDVVGSGTSVSNVSNITVHFDGSQAGYYDCERPAHGNVEPYLVVWQWDLDMRGC